MDETQAAAQRASQVVPSERQLAWQRREFIAFAHFGIDTFTDREWGQGDEDPRIFNPTAFDADQWAETCRDTGMRMLILTAKHHDGFCLWPSAWTSHSVAASPWRQGRGDVVAEVARACERAGVGFGVYCSPWDRHEPTYGDSPAYNGFFRRQLTELVTGYGPIGEVWFDGACGEGANGRRQEYDWDSFYEVVRRHQPDAVIAICGPDVRWVGNESGLARQDEWSVMPAGPGVDLQARDLGSRQHLAGSERLVWYPAECDVSIRPGWFYHAEQDLQVKSLDHLLDIYYQSVGRNSVLLLNVPPDQRGLFHEHDVARLRELRAALDATFGEDLARGARAAADSSAGPGHGPERVVDGDRATFWMAGAETGTVELDLGAEKPFDRLLLQEPVEQGQRLERFVLEGWHQGGWKPIVEGGAVGYKRLDRFGRVAARRVRLAVRQSRACPALRTLGLYCAGGT